MSDGGVSISLFSGSWRTVLTTSSSAFLCVQHCDLDPISLDLIHKWEALVVLRIVKKVDEFATVFGPVCGSCFISSRALAP